METATKRQLKKMTKREVKKQIRETGAFTGYLCGNKVNPFHVNDGWHLGMHVTETSVESLDDTIERFETGLRLHTPQIGTYCHFYKEL